MTRRIKIFLKVCKNTQNKKLSYVKRIVIQIESEKIMTGKILRMSIINI